MYRHPSSLTTHVLRFTDILDNRWSLRSSADVVVLSGAVASASDNADDDDAVISTRQCPSTGGDVCSTIFMPGAPTRWLQDADAAAAAAAAAQCDVPCHDRVSRAYRITCSGSVVRMSSGGSAVPKIRSRRCCVAGQICSQCSRVCED